MTMAQQLIVEGKDGIFISVLCKKCGLEKPEGYADDQKFKKEFINEAGGYDNAIKALKEALDNPSLQNIGIVVDADELGPAARWDAVKAVLSQKIPDIQLPSDPDPFGTVVRHNNNLVVGIWIMPDNQQIGYLEHFIERLIPAEQDAIRRHANDKVEELSSLNLQRFTDPKKQKAMLHTWLAWQQQPGSPFGTALNEGYLDHEAELARHFVEWFKTVFILS